MSTIAVIIPTHNRLSYLKVLIEQLLNQDLDSTVDLKIIVVVDESGDSSLTFLKNNFPGLEIVRGNGDFWYTRSINEGMKIAQKFNPDFLLTLNDDVEINSDYIKTILADFNALQNEKSIIGSLSVTNDDIKLIYSAGNYNAGKSLLNTKPLVKKLSIVYNEHFKGIVDTFDLPGRGILIPNEIAIKLNYLSDSLPQYGSDTDFCVRARKMGFNVFMSYNAVVYIHVNDTKVHSIKTKGAILKLFAGFFDIYSHVSLKKFYLTELSYTENRVRTIFNTFKYAFLMVLNEFKAYMTMTNK